MGKRDVSDSQAERSNAVERQYVITERAHLMCPNMHFALLIKIDAAYERAKVKDTMDLLSQAHPFLRSVIGWEDEGRRPFYRVGADSRISMIEREDACTLWQDYKTIGETSWNVFEEGLLKVFSYPGETGFQVLFAAYHLLADGRRLLELCSEFAELYVRGGKADFAEERLIAGSSDLPPGSSLSAANRLLLTWLNRQWKREKQQVTNAQYMAFAERFSKENPVEYACCSIDQKRVTAMSRFCREQQISVNDLLLSRLFLATKAPNIIMAVDIQNQLSCYQRGALGNYASAMSIRRNSSAESPLLLAKRIHRQVTEHLADKKKSMLILSCYLQLAGTLIDAAAISSLGDFDSKAARFVGNNILGYGRGEGISITNLGSINHQYIREVVFIPPASPATKATFGVVTVNGKMQLCCSYYKKSVQTEDICRQMEQLTSI